MLGTLRGSNRNGVTAVCGTMLVMTCLYYSGSWVGRQSSIWSGEASNSDEKLLLLSRNNDFLDVDKILGYARATNSPPAGYRHDEDDVQPPIAAPATHSKQVITKDLYVDEWVKSCPDLCKDKKEPLLLAVVISAPDHFLRRKAIRESWGAVAAKGKHSAIAYLVGLPAKDERLLNELERENVEYGDLVITKNVDTYVNLTLKTLAAFRWRQTYCGKADFLFKTDDDMFVQMKKLLLAAKGIRRSYLKNPPGPLIVGREANGWKPVRNPNSKYFATKEQYSDSVYPPFVTGPSYLVSGAAIDVLLRESLEMPFFHLEDVFVTGIAAENASVPRRASTEFRNNPHPIPAQFMGCTLTRTISIHQVAPEDQGKLLAMSRNPRCGKKRPSRQSSSRSRPEEH